MRSLFCRLCLLAVCTALFPGAGITSSVTTAANPGDVIRGTTYPSVYYLGADGLRYVFPNDKTYFTWYSNFAAVKWISDAELGNIQIGGNITYKPGVKMMKIDTDPKTYAVEEGGMLRWVESESLAASLYGGDWNKKIDDLPDAFFTNYTVGPSVKVSSDYVLADVMANTTDIGDDKDIVVPAIISITGTTYSPIQVTIEVGQSVRFVNDDVVQHTVTAEDLMWGSGTLAPGAEFVHTFNHEGTYPFFDSYNSRLTGAVYVVTNL